MFCVKTKENLFLFTFTDALQSKRTELCVIHNKQWALRNIAEEENEGKQKSESFTILKRKKDESHECLFNQALSYVYICYLISNFTFYSPYALEYFERDFQNTRSRWFSLEREKT